MTVGNRIFLQRDLQAAPWVEAFRTLPAAVVADCMSRLPALACDIRLMSNPSHSTMCGLAVTVKARSGCNLMLHKAMDMAGNSTFSWKSYKNGYIMLKLRKYQTETTRMAVQ